ncbi:MAG: isopentenyl-diphosphate Delta-isomerase [Woeseiaceae bacterium]|nr:isopentenyl-diphosphate Delta-isomerase [Woeseiaceae bacterium]
MTTADAEHGIVSSDEEELILVDADDRETGSLSKAECHDGAGILHRAFSVFVFNSRGELLLQQRAGGKRLWPLYWSNSCCSHPRKGEEMAVATERRLQQELGLSATLEFVYKFSYQARYGDIGAEHELCWVYLGRTDGPVVPNANEIAAVRFVGQGELATELAQHGDRFTPWFRLEWQRCRQDFAGQLARLRGARPRVIA